MAESGIDHEESLLEETMNREQDYLAKISSLESDLKFAQQVCCVEYYCLHDLIIFLII